MFFLLLANGSFLSFTDVAGLSPLNGLLQCHYNALLRKSQLQIE
jgi:hypothetical protein